MPASLIKPKNPFQTSDSHQSAC